MTLAPVPPALFLDRLTKRYGASLALDGVSLMLEAGVGYGLTGPNGGGKSTLLRIIATLERPTSGRVVIHGHDTASQPRAARRLIGYAGRPIGTLELTAAEELDFAGQLAGLGRAEAAETTAAMLQLVELYERRHRTVAQLSQGDRRRLTIARALVHDPAVLLLDDPFHGLDAAARADLRAVLGELVALGKTLLIAAGTVGELGGLCQEVGLLERGRLLLSGSAEDLLRSGTGSGRLVRLRVARRPGADPLADAELVLSGHGEVSEVGRLDDERLLFRIAGDETTQAGLMVELVAAGIPLIELSAATEDADVELARRMRAATGAVVAASASTAEAAGVGRDTERS